MTNLEKEFEKAKDIHKHVIVEMALAKFEKDGIYETPLLREKYGKSKVAEDNLARSERVTNDLSEQNKEQFDLVYEMCWRRMRNIVAEDRSYRLEQ